MTNEIQDLMNQAQNAPVPQGGTEQGETVPESDDSDAKEKDGGTAPEQPEATTPAEGDKVDPAALADALKEAIGDKAVSTLDPETIAEAIVAAQRRQPQPAVTGQPEITADELNAMTPAELLDFIGKKLPAHATIRQLANGYQQLQAKLAMLEMQQELATLAARRPEVAEVADEVRDVMLQTGLDAQRAYALYLGQKQVGEITGKPAQGGKKSGANPPQGGAAPQARGPQTGGAGQTPQTARSPAPQSRGKTANPCKRQAYGAQPRRRGDTRRKADSRNRGRSAPAGRESIGSPQSRGKRLSGGVTVWGKRIRGRQHGFLYAAT